MKMLFKLIIFLTIYQITCANVPHHTSPPIHYTTPKPLPIYHSTLKPSPIYHSTPQPYTPYGSLSNSHTTPKPYIYRGINHTINNSTIEYNCLQECVYYNFHTIYNYSDNNNFSISINVNNNITLNKSTSYIFGNICESGIKKITLSSNSHIIVNSKYYKCEEKINWVVESFLITIFCLFVITIIGISIYCTNHRRKYYEDIV